MKTQQPIIREDEEHRVLKFVPRTSAQAPRGLPDRGFSDLRHSDPQLVGPNAPLHEHDDLKRFEQPRNELKDEAKDEPDDFRHRMLANTAAFALTVILTGIGIWLAISIADLRKTQDCVLMGRRDCARIAAPQM